MILTTVILLILISCWIKGFHRGIVAMMLSLGVYLISWRIAQTCAPLFGNILAGILPAISNNYFNDNLLSGLNATNFFYRGIALMIIFGLCSGAGYWLIRRLNWLDRLPVLGTVSHWTGGMLNVLLGYLMIFVFLMVCQLIPIDWWQYQLSQSEVAQLIIAQTPNMVHVMAQWLG